MCLSASFTTGLTATPPVSLVSLPARAARSCAVSFMVLSMLASALPAGHTESAPHSHSGLPTSATVAHQAGFEFLSLWALVVSAWTAFRSQPEICQDCNLPVNGGCRCPCYSGGYDPMSPDCQ